MSKIQHKITTKLLLPALAVVSLSTIIFGDVKPAQATASVCSDVEVIFVHGAASDIDDNQDVVAWKGAFQNQNFGSLTLSYYNLGESDRYGARYDGADIGASSLAEIKNTLETFFAAGQSGEFNETVEKGITELSNRISTTLKNCPSTKFIFGGYSEGAYLLHNFFNGPAPALGLTTENVVYVATFGDPKLYLPEGEGTNPPACRNEAFSSYRVYAPNCRTYAGILGAEKPYFPEGYIEKAGLWCFSKDPFCSSYFNIFEVSKMIDVHTSYASDDPEPYKQAATIIRQKLAALFPEKISPSEETVHSAARDTAILIDTTGSMKNRIDKYRKEALKIAKTTIDSGGRIALYEYRDLKADGREYVPNELCDFSCTYEEFEDYLSALETDGGGDDPESALSASLGVMNKLSWQKGATKSIVLLTDATYHDADLDGTTLSDVVKRSLEIDPVNFYVVTTNEAKTSYTQLTSKTNGQSFSLSADDIALSSKVLLGRPDLNFQFESYETSAGEIASFLVDTSATTIDHFEWDLDFDGVFEITTTSPTISYLYTTPTAGFVQAKVVLTSGLSSTASALVTVTSGENLGEKPTISNLQATIADDSAQISYQKSDNASAIIVVLDDYILGVTATTEFTITDLGFHSHTLTLIPVSDTGLRGDPVTETLSPDFDEEEEPTETVVARATSPDLTIPKAPNTALPKFSTTD
ncbi:cutinase family protein [Candidatus Saccharibacteria bacterium]|nr:cutinase family protein [Candidatus Saccharibacteria bacterium]